MTSSSAAAAAPDAGASGRRPLGAARPRRGEQVVHALLLACAAVSVLVTAAIVSSLVRPTISFLSEVPVGEFFTGTLWAPDFANPSYGVLPIVVGTVYIVLISLCISVPVGLSSAIFLSEYAPAGLRRAVKPALETLEGIPTVVIGLFGFLLLRPLMGEWLPFLPWQGPFSTLVAGVAVGLLTVPLVASVADDAMRAVPRGLREGAYALGSNEYEVSTRVVVPGAISGIVAGVVLSASRAVGETMVVLMVAGAGNPNLNLDPIRGIQTMTAYIANRSTGDIPATGLSYDTIFAVGALLFAATLVLNIFAIRFVRRFREVYD
jgi:phosphate transport system permease protein